MSKLVWGSYYLEWRTLQWQGRHWGSIGTSLAVEGTSQLARLVIGSEDSAFSKTMERVSLGSETSWFGFRMLS